MHGHTTAWSSPLAFAKALRESLEAAILRDEGRLAQENRDAPQSSMLRASRFRWEFGDSIQKQVGIISAGVDIPGPLPFTLALEICLHLASFGFKSAMAKNSESSVNEAGHIGQISTFFPAPSSQVSSNLEPVKDPATAEVEPVKVVSLSVVSAEAVLPKAVLPKAVSPKEVAPTTVELQETPPTKKSSPRSRRTPPPSNVSDPLPKVKTERFEKVTTPARPALDNLGLTAPIPLTNKASDTSVTPPVIYDRALINGPRRKSKAKEPTLAKESIPRSSAAPVLGLDHETVLSIPVLYGIADFRQALGSVISDPRIGTTHLVAGIRAKLAAEYAGTHQDVSREEISYFLNQLLLTIFNQSFWSEKPELAKSVLTVGRRLKRHWPLDAQKIPDGLEAFVRANETPLSKIKAIKD